MFPSDAADDHERGPAVGSTAAAEALARAVDGLLAVDAEHLSDTDLAAAMVGLRRQQARLAAAVSELTGVFDARRVWAEDGSRSATDWIAVRAWLPRAQVAGEVRDARRLRTMPATRAAWHAGDVSPAHVRGLTRLAGHPRAGEHFPDGEGLLLREARRSRFDDWERLCAHWRDAADPDGPEPRRGRDHDLRRFRIGVGLDGVGHPDGYLTPLAAATVTGALERIEAELFTADWAAAQQVHGDETSVAHLARSAAQRRHDALVEMAERALSAPTDGQRPAPLVTVMVDYPTLAGRVCELASGAVLAPGDIAELLARDDTLMQRVVFDGPNRVRDISSARTFRGTLRRVLDVVHRRCNHPHLLRPRPPVPGRPHRSLVPRRNHHPRQRPPGLRHAQPLVVQPRTGHRPTTGRRPAGSSERSDRRPPGAFVHHPRCLTRPRRHRRRRSNRDPARASATGRHRLLTGSRPARPRPGAVRTAVFGRAARTTRVTTRRAA